jgi:hypothetical protein
MERRGVGRVMRARWPAQSVILEALLMPDADKLLDRHASATRWDAIVLASAAGSIVMALLWS